VARAVLITNPVAARTTDAAVQAAAAVLRGGGWSLDVLPTAGPGDARRLAREAVATGVDLVAVQGGDGTTMQAAAELVGTEIPLGIIPGGTGNLLAGNLGIPRDPADASRVLLGGRGRRIDLGRVERAQGPVYFSVACGTGVDARVMAQTPSLRKRRWGMAAYFATMFKALPAVRSVPYRVVADGERWEGMAAMVLIMNCGKLIPPFLSLGPTISPEDGTLDVIVVRAEGPWDGVRAALQALWDLPAAARKGTFIRYVQGRVVTIESETPEPVEMDGDADGLTPLTAEVVPAAIAVLTPDGQPLR
jgi:YegS/Rv2252/BmrU family lipid kinase